MDLQLLRSVRTGRFAPALVAVMLVAALLPVGFVPTVFAAASVTRADATMSADTAANAAVPAWTTLIGPALTEATAGDLVNGGEIVLTVPAGFQFQAGAGSVAIGGTSCPNAMTLGTLTVTATTATVLITHQSSVDPCQVTFSGLKVRPLAGTPLASGNITNAGTTGPGGATSYGTLTETVGVAAKLAFTQQPSTSAASTAFASQPRVAIADAAGNAMTSASATVTLTLTAGSGSLGGCTAGVATSGGIATFSSCYVTSTGIGKQLTAAATGLTSATSALFDIADNLAFETQPGGGAGTGSMAQGGIAFASQPKVTVRAGTSNFTTNKAVNDGTTTVTLGIRSGTGTAGAILICDQAANVLRVTGGSAQFTGCRIDKSGTGYQLVATSVPSYGASVWYSSAFDVVAGSATTLMFVTQPAGAAAGQVFTTQPVVAITDAGGNIVASGVSANVSLTIGANPGIPAGALSCTPGNTVATATGGVNAGKAIFSGCKISNAGVGYTLLATPTSIVPGTTTLLSAASTAFTVGAPAAQITLTPSAPTITWGATVVLTTQFLVNGSGKVFMLQAARDGVSWATITTLTTDAFGRSSFPYRPANNLYYRAVFGGTSDLQAATSLTARTVVRQISFLRPTNSGATKSIARNTSITFTTTVRPARPDLPVAKVSFYFYRQVGGSWVLITKRDVYVNATGLARTTFKFTSSGQWYVRSAANPTTYNANSVPSPRERYNVY